MRALQKLTRNGNGTAVTVPRVVARRLGWSLGERVTVERFEDDTLRVRRPCEQDFPAVGTAQLAPSLRKTVKLVQNGGSIGVNLPRPMLFHLGWLPGEHIILELLDETNVLRLRRTCDRDFAPVSHSHILDTPLATVKT